MKVITAPNPIELYLAKANKPSVFLAGGITNCPNWQEAIIDLLKSHDDAVLLNPRRKNFPIGNPEAAEEQIKWEFNALNSCDIFSIWFSNAPSDQPICMYELGRHLALRCSEPWVKPWTVVVGVEEGYKRSQDVHIQTRLVNRSIANRISSTLEAHAQNILSVLHRKPRVK